MPWFSMKEKEETTYRGQGIYIYSWPQGTINIAYMIKAYEVSYSVQFM